MIEREKVFAFLMRLGETRSGEQDYRTAEVIFSQAFNYAGTVEERVLASKRADESEALHSISTRPMRERKEREERETCKSLLDQKDAYYKGQIDLLKGMLK